MRTSPDTFLEVISPRLTQDSIDTDRDTAIRLATTAFGLAPGATWPALRGVFAADSAFGETVFSQVAYRSDVNLAAELDDRSLPELLHWLFIAVPPSGDPPFVSGAVPPRVEAGHVRDRLLAALAERGTDEAVAAVESLAAAYPSYTMTLRKVQAQEARLARWTAPEPGDVIRLAQSNDARIVLSDTHLQQVVMAALRRVQKQLQSGAPATAGELWNTRGSPTPKHEEELSTWLVSRLNGELKLGGRVIGRELEIRANATGRGRGESVDITVLAPVGTHVEDAPIASIAIEVKGCWHRELLTAMETQLVQRYLTNTQTTHGIYLVFWFASDLWDLSDHRRVRCPTDVAGVREALLAQAAALSRSTSASVQALVIDATIR